MPGVESVRIANIDGKTLGINTAKLASDMGAITTILDTNNVNNIRRLRYLIDFFLETLVTIVSQ